MLVCHVCANENPDLAAVCGRCGAELRRGSATVPGSPLAAAVAHPPEPLATRFRAGVIVDGKYRIDAVIGEGGMGVVYLATDVNTDTKVVVKALLPELARNPEFRARVRGEARALAHIDHPNVVRLNAVVSSDDALLLVMQYVEGQSLDRLIQTHVAMREPFPLDAALALFRQIVLGVGAAHAEGVVHRDIKPGNVLVRAKDGVAKVTDFGIAKDEADAKAGRGQTRGIIGSLWYMSPEQLTGQRDLDKRVDIYALGILLFELLTGRVPFDGASDYDIMKLHVEAALPRVSAVRSDVPAALDDVLQRACAKNREQRYASCRELLDAIDAAVAPAPRPATMRLPLDHGPTSVAAPSVGPASSIALHDATPAKRGPLVLVAAVIVLGVLGGGAWALFGGHGESSAAPSASASHGASHDVVAPPPSTPPKDAAAAPKDALAALVGRWVSDSGRHYDAALGPSGLELRVRDPAEFPGQNYEAGEARFALVRTSDPGAFLVEDKLRPVPPKGTTYAPISRPTCQEIWTEVRGAKLHATFDGTKLRVDLVKVTPDKAAFEIKAGKVVGCEKLGSSAAERIESTLTRE